MRWRPSAVALAALLGLAASALPPPGAAASTSSATPRWPAYPDWARYVEGPATTDVHPVGVVHTVGEVTDPGALVRPSGGGATTLMFRRGGVRPMVVLSYGKDVGGVPFFSVRSRLGTPRLRASYSEERAGLGQHGDGDGAPGGNGSSDPSRADSFTITRRGTLTTGLIQGGERYEELTLTTPGRVILSSVGIRFTALLATAADYPGWFDSSSPALDRLWYDGAYTVQLDQLPAGTLPDPWQAGPAGLRAEGGLAGVLRRGAGWTDYTMSFDTDIVHNESGWVVRASAAGSGYLFVLGDATDRTGAPDTLRAFAVGPSTFADIGSARLPEAIAAGSWHYVRTVVAGNRITIFVDGRRVAGFTANAPSVDARGSVGFDEYPGRTAVFRHLTVSAADHVTLFAGSLQSSSAPTEFTGSGIGPQDPLSLILDGAKRDREVWSADLGVEERTIFASTATDRYVRDSLQLLGSYQNADGEVAGDLPPTAALGTFPETTGTFSTSYSMDEVDNIATYALSTGDLSFVRQEWPMLTRDLTYAGSQVDGRGLLRTNAKDGSDWDYYDPTRTGEVTAFNDIYFATLQDAAAMAHDLGLPGPAAAYRLEASHLRAAINTYLYDPGRHLYVNSDLQPLTVPQDGNALAVLYGVAPAGQAPAILAALRRVLPITPYGPLPFTTGAGYRVAVSPYTTDEEVQADFAVGDAPAALGLLATLWGHMDASGPDFSGADWEVVGADGTPGFGPYTSLAHGWSSGPTSALTTYVLGVQPTAPGFRTWLVAPQPGGLTWAEGQVPTPEGRLTVRWAQRPATGQFALQVRAPGHTSGTVTVPVPPSGATVTVRNAENRTRTLVTRTTGTSTASFRLAGGRTYRISVTPRQG